MARTIAENDLKEGGGHISYEWMMLRTSESLSLSPPYDVTLPLHTQFDFNARIELVLIHARNLHDFLFGGSGEPTDIWAVDYLTEPNLGLWRKERKKYCRYLKDNKTRIHKSLAHPTYDRNRMTTKSWDIPLIRQELSQALIAYATKLTPTRLGYFSGLDK